MPRLFGDWTVLSTSSSRKHYWKCRCVCGVEKEILKYNLTPTLKSKGCGCRGWSTETRRKGATKHGDYGTPTYKAWQNMKARLKTRWEYAELDMAERWKVYENFKADLGECPAGYSLERVDNKSGYHPDNCKWIPRGDQAKNTRRQVWLTYEGRTQIAADWARERGINVNALYGRIKRGWTIQQALGFEPRRQPSKGCH